MEDWHQYVGLVGTVLYVGSYFLLQTGRLNGAGITYVMLNMIAASLVLFSLAFKFNLASSLIQIAWILISVAGLYRIATDKQESSPYAPKTDAARNRTESKRVMASRVIV